MKKLETISEHELLFLARQELSRKIDEYKNQIIQNKTKQSLRRTKKILERLCEQKSEITQRMAEINNENVE